MLARINPFRRSFLDDLPCGIAFAYLYFYTTCAMGLFGLPWALWFVVYAVDVALIAATLVSRIRDAQDKRFIAQRHEPARTDEHPPAGEE